MTPEERFKIHEQTMAEIDALVKAGAQRHEQAMAYVDERLKAVAENQERHDLTLAYVDERLRSIASTLQRAIKLGVREVRAERRRRAAAMAEIDDKLTKLAAAQLSTEEEQKRLDQALRRFLEGRNGNGKPS